MPLVAQLFPTVTLHDAPAFMGTGLLAAVTVPDTLVDDAAIAQLSRDHDVLQDSEIALCKALPAPRRASFVAGRVALRSALTALSPDFRSAPLLRTSRGAPALPAGVIGSISHKRSLAIAYVAMETDGVATIGVDLEDRPPPHVADRYDLSTRILTEHENIALRSLGAAEKREATLLRFAIKEAVYKAIDPHVHRYVHFTEVEVDVRDDGTANVTLNLRELAGLETPIRIAWWKRTSHLVAMAVGSRVPRSL